MCGPVTNPDPAMKAEPHWHFRTGQLFISSNGGAGFRPRIPEGIFTYPHIANQPHLFDTQELETRTNPLKHEGLIGRHETVWLQKRVQNAYVDGNILSVGDLTATVQFLFFQSLMLCGHAHKVIATNPTVTLVAS
jgi:hypothetical protein